MIETHNEVAKNIISNMSPNEMKHISQLFPVKATPGTSYALPKLHKHSHLISTKANAHTTDDNIISTTQLIDKATNLNIRPHRDLYYLRNGHYRAYFLICCFQSPCHDSVIIYQNQHVELTLRLCFFRHIYIYIYAPTSAA